MIDGRPRLGTTGRYRRRMGRVVVTPTILSEIYGTLESFGFDVHVFVRVESRNYDGISLDEIALLPLQERELISSISLVAKSDYARLNIVFEKRSEAEFTAIGDDDRLLAPVISAINQRLSRLETFWSVADFVAMGAGLGVLLILLSPLILAVTELRTKPAAMTEMSVGPGLAIAALVITLLFGMAVAASYTAPACRFSWTGVSQRDPSRLFNVAPKVVRYLSIAIWTIAAAVVAQIIGSFLWERIVN